MVVRGLGTVFVIVSLLFSLSCGSDSENSNSSQNNSTQNNMANPADMSSDADPATTEMGDESDMGSDAALRGDQGDDNQDTGADSTGESDATLESDTGDESDAGDSGADGGAIDMAPDGGEEFDPILICLEDCAYQGVHANEVDCDYDGLSNAEELQLGTDPCSNDTDGDGLPDLAELQNGSDPNSADSDGDGLEDGDEIKFGFDPNNPSTLNDMILDGDRWIVSACDNPTSEPVDFYFSAKGDWQVALPPAFNNHTELTISTATPSDKLAAAVYDDPSNEVSGFVLSMVPGAGFSGPVDVILAALPNVGSLGTVLQDSTGGEFDTHDFNLASIGRYLIRTSQPQSSRQTRDALLFALSPFGQADVSGLPNSSGNTYTEYRIFLSATYRADAVAGDRVIITVSVAPAEKFDTREKVKFRMDDLTNTTNVSQAGDGQLIRCSTFQAGEGNPEADFYWMLDQSGSMYDDYAKVKQVANLFYNNLQNTTLDFRLAVSHMDIAYTGRPRANVGWFNDLTTFIGEIDDIINSNYDCCDEFGLQCAQDGITWMRSTSAPQSMRIRSSAQLITIFMSDEEAQTIQDNPLSGAAGVQKLTDFQLYFSANTIAFAIVGDRGGSTGGNCGSSDGKAYRQVALSTGGTAASLCANDISETIDDIIYAATGLASNYIIPDTPISSTLRVFKNNEWIPRSRDNGFDYFAQTNSIAFFGSYRPQPADPTQGRYGDDIAVSYQTFLDTTK